MANKLNIVNGIIQDQAIAGVPVVQKIVLGKGKKNVRTLLQNNVNAICYHNTANTSPTADAENHARYLQNLENADKTYLSVHLFVDQDSIVQCLPLNEIAYHAGTAEGNRNSIAIEICENGNIAQAEKIAQELGASLLMTYPALQIKKHQDYSGKYCPRVILNRGGWVQFTNEIKALATGQNNVQAGNPVAVSEGFLIKVIVSELNIRSTPNVAEGNIVGSIKKDNKSYTIIEVSPNGWGKLKSGAGWINISNKYVKRI
jgi:N-acetylmuramoyl-L-alanine amidase